MSEERSLVARAGGEPVDGGRGPGPLRELPATLAPHPNLLRYYAVSSLAAGPFFAFVLLPLYFRYRTLRYEVDDEGITARWGILFRKEISLTYSRIQDIHLASNVLERWLGLARIQVQTASGSSAAEMMIQGMREYGAIRDFLYSRMRGAREGSPHAARAAAGTAPAGLAAPVAAELTQALHEITAELRALRAELPAGASARRASGAGAGADDDGDPAPVHEVPHA